LGKPGLFQPLSEPPCSYCSTENRKGFVKPGDRVVAWIRGAHNGGAVPLRHFLSAPRVINDTYGLFFYDPDGGYVSMFKKDYGYQFHGWRDGVMIVRGADGTLWSALSGQAIEGLQKGRRLERVPSMMTDWGYWLMLHPESTAYNLFDGRKYRKADLPVGLSPEAKQTMGTVDPRLKPLDWVLGIEQEGRTRAYPLDGAGERACFNDKVDGEPVAIFWHQATRCAVAFSSKLKGRELHFFADSVSPETAPIKDQETGSRWTMAGRAVDGPLRGEELRWISGVQCRWYAWIATFPDTGIFRPPG
jgi:hypothetical protein